MSKCKSCKAEVIWAVSMNGTPMPLDPKPEKRVVLGPVARDDGTRQCKVVDTYVSHWSTCPNADAHRRKPNAGA